MAVNVNNTILSAGLVICNVLKNNSDVQAITKGKIYPVVSTDKAILPYVVYRRAAIDSEQIKSGKSSDKASIEIICFAENYEASIMLAEAVRAALDGKCFSQDNLVMRSCYLSDSEEVWQDDAFLQRLTFVINI